MTKPVDRDALFAAIAEEGYVRKEDVLQMRRDVFADGTINTEEVDWLFALADETQEGDQEWTTFFCEAVTDYFLREEEPEGYLTDDEFAVLERWACAKGAMLSDLELELMLTLQEKAVTCPDDMSAFIRDQIKTRILSREGKPRISADDLTAIRRTIYAAGGEGNVAVTRAEAHFLFALNDQCDACDDPQGWIALFKKAISSHLMAHIGYEPISREEAVRIDKGLRGDEPSEQKSGGFFSRVKAALANPAEELERRFEERNTAREEDALAAEQLTFDETEWTQEQIMADGNINAAEAALIAYLKEINGELPQKLRELVDNAA